MTAARFMLSPLVQNFKPKISSRRDNRPRLVRARSSPTPAASPPEAHTVVPDPFAPLFSLLEGRRRPCLAPPGIGPARRTDLPSNQKCAPDKYATRQSPWVHAPSAAPVQST